MDADVKARWVAALRSGEYRQGRRRLRTFKDEYCCLGVLCEVEGLSKEKGKEVWKYEGKGPDGKTTWFAIDIPYDFAERIALGGTWVCALIIMNDEVNRSFVEIADWIEAHL